MKWNEYYSDKEVSGEMEPRGSRFWRLFLLQIGTTVFGDGDSLSQQYLIVCFSSRLHVIDGN